MFQEPEDTPVRNLLLERCKASASPKMNVPHRTNVQHPVSLWELEFRRITEIVGVAEHPGQRCDGDMRPLMEKFPRIRIENVRGTLGYHCLNLELSPNKSCIESTSEEPLILGRKLATCDRPSTDAHSGIIQLKQDSQTNQPPEYCVKEYPLLKKVTFLNSTSNTNDRWLKLSMANREMEPLELVIRMDSIWSTIGKVLSIMTIAIFAMLIYESDRCLVKQPKDPP